ncbi:MAG: hypothetical protein U0X39_03955 [Bacteroidales bacterium]
MSSRVLFVCATETEASSLKNAGVGSGDMKPFGNGDINFTILVTGVGGIATAWSLKKWLSMNPAPDLAINIGIAGSYNPAIIPGDIVIPVKDCFADLGIETNGQFVPLSSTSFLDGDGAPLRGGFIHCENEYLQKICPGSKRVTAATVNTATGSEASINRIKRFFNPDIETMEGATFFYIFAIEKIPFLAIRSISNMVEPDRSSWDIGLAISRLATGVEEMIKQLL